MVFLRRLLGWSSDPAAAPSVPEGRRIYAIGDVHGRSDLLDRMADLIAADVGQRALADATTVFLGDYVDRGPDSRGVLDRLVRRDFPTETVLLQGNHEAMLLGFLAEPATGESWRHNGGLETIRSYGVDVRLVQAGKGYAEAASALRDAIPETHHHLLRGMKLTLEVGDYFFCHAGVRPGVPLARQLPEDLLWIREPFLSSGMSYGKIVVHGHSPVTQPEVRLNRINIDTGAFGSGRLTALVLEGSERRFLSSSNARL